MQLFPDKDWWWNRNYGSGIEGFIRQHVPAHVGQGFILFWVMLWAEVSPVKWAVIFTIFWELLQRERWRRDSDGTNRMPIVENVWDVLLGGVGIGLALLLKGIL